MRYKFMKQETPIEASTGVNIFRYYPQAGKLTVHKKMWADERGELHDGGFVIVNVGALRNNPDAVALFKRVLSL